MNASSSSLIDDPVGQQAVQDAASCLPPGNKTYVAHLPDYKDASEALSDNDFESVREAIWNANPYQPDGIVDAKTLYESVLDQTDTCFMSTHSPKSTRKNTRDPARRACYGYCWHWDRKIHVVSSACNSPTQ